MGLNIFGHSHPTIHSEGEPTNVIVEGMEALYRAFELAADRLHEEARRETWRSAKAVAVRAKYEAQAAGLFDSGRLVSEIDSEVIGDTAYIVDRAARNGYPYPGRYEFGDRERPFLQPALEKEFDNIVTRFTAIIDRAVNLADGPT